MPMWSAVARLVPRLLNSAPRSRLPPPTTIATSTPSRCTRATLSASVATTSGSTPLPLLPRLSPLSLSRIRRILVGSGIAGSTAEREVGEAADLDVLADLADELLAHLLDCARVGLV